MGAGVQAHAGSGLAVVVGSVPPRALRALRHGPFSVTLIDQDGKFLNEWKQFGRPSGIFIDAKDTIYVTDSQSDEKVNPGIRQGIRIGSTKDGVVKMFIPALGPETKPTSVTEGVSADAMGNVYGAETGSKNLRKYAKN